MHLFPGVAVFRHSLYHAPSVDVIYIYIFIDIIYIYIERELYIDIYRVIYIYAYMNVCSPKWIKMVQLPYFRRVIMNCHYLGKLQYAPVLFHRQWGICSSSPDSAQALRVAAESWVAHMVCCGWYLCASLQTAVPSLGRVLTTTRSGETLILGWENVGGSFWKCHPVTGRYWELFRMKFESKERSQLWCRMI